MLLNRKCYTKYCLRSRMRYGRGRAWLTRESKTNRSCPITHPVKPFLTRHTTFHATLYETVYKDMKQSIKPKFFKTYRDMISFEQMMSSEFGYYLMIGRNPRVFIIAPTRHSCYLLNNPYKGSFKHLYYVTDSNG